MLRNYRTIDTCMNCKFCVTDFIQDGGIDYYCNLDETLNENFLTGGYPLKDGISFEESNNWLDVHRVNENTICDDSIMG